MILEFDNYYVNAITAGDIRKWITESKVKYANSTINARLRTMRLIFDSLVEDEVLSSNPAKKVKTLPEERTKGRRGTALTASQLRAFITEIQAMSAKGEISEDIGRMLLVLALTGMRRGEIMALKWEDWQDNELFIRRSVYFKKKRLENGKTDDPRCVATVGLLDEVLKAQLAWLSATKHPGRSTGLIFPASPRHAKGAATRTGRDICWLRSKTTLNNPIAKVVKASKIPEVSNHSLRRTFENLLRQSGVGDLVRRSLAGWRSEGAQEIYAGVAPSERRKAAENLQSHIFSESGSDKAQGSKVRPSGTPSEFGVSNEPTFDA